MTERTVDHSSDLHLKMENEAIDDINMLTEWQHTASKMAT